MVVTISEAVGRKEFLSSKMRVADAWNPCSYTISNQYNYHCLIPIVTFGLINKNIFSLLPFDKKQVK